MQTRLGQLLDQLITPLRTAILPRPHYLRDETVQIEIRMAPYRQRVARHLVYGSLLLASIAILALMADWLLAVDLPIDLIAGVGIIIALMGILNGLNYLLMYEQWRFFITDKRYIITTPAPSRFGFADVIYLKRGKIQVVDTNWSPNMLWGFFQATTGARDVVLSLAGYEFKPEGAEVKGGLRFPDIMPADISCLEELIFG